MKILDNGFIELGSSCLLSNPIIKISKIQAIKPLNYYKDLQILVIVDGVAFTVLYNKHSECDKNRQERDDEFLKLTNLLATKQKKNN